jgi:hypothetical protein
MGQFETESSLDGFFGRNRTDLLVPMTDFLKILLGTFRYPSRGPGA